MVDTEMSWYLRCVMQCRIHPIRHGVRRTIEVGLVAYDHHRVLAHHVQGIAFVAGPDDDCIAITLSSVVRIMSVILNLVGIAVHIIGIFVFPREEIAVEP